MLRKENIVYLFQLYLKSRLKYSYRGVVWSLCYTVHVYSLNIEIYIVIKIQISQMLLH